MVSLKKFKLSNAPSTSRFDIGETKQELRAKLRFHSKKPLCLQYNLSATQRTKKVLQKMKRRNCDSFTKVFIPYLISLIYTLIVSTGKVMEFLFKPVEELDLKPVNPSYCRGDLRVVCPTVRKTLSRSFSMSSRRSSRKQKKIQKKDLGRIDKIKIEQNRLTEFCVFP